MPQKWVLGEEPVPCKTMNQITFQSVYNTTTSAQVAIGQQAQTPDGRLWTYVKAGGAIAKNLVAIPNTVTTVTTVSSSTNNQGQIVYITKASAGWTVGAFTGAYGLVNTGTGTGQSFKIIGNTVDTLYLAPETALGTALSVSDSGIAIYRENEVIIAAVTSKIQNAVGITQINFASADYGWILTKGVGGVIAGEALTIGAGFVTGDDTAGEVVKATTAKGSFDEQYLGRCLVANSGADIAALVWVNIA